MHTLLFEGCVASSCPLSSASDLTEGLLSKGRKVTHREQRKASRRRSPTSSPAPSSSSSSSSGYGSLSVGDGVAIIAGTCIGGGFLALPSLTTPMGFMPAVTGLFASWAFLVMTSLAYAEATLHSIAKQDAERAADPGLAEAAVDEQPECSVLTVTRCSLGTKASVVCSGAFATLMFVVMTAQVVKCGEILSVLLNLPYVWCCIVPSIAVGLFSFCAGTRLVEQVNTVLAVALVGGFVALIFNTVAAGWGTELSTITERLAFADWRMLLPVGPAWTLPVFINLISFGQTVPVVVCRFGVERARDIQTSIVLGSFIPFALCAAWAAVSAALLNLTAAGQDVATDPVLRMMTAGRAALALPVEFVAAGAIGTSLIGNYLSLGQFATDGIFALCGRCTRSSKFWARAAVVTFPLVLACGGPELYLPLLAFAGAYPTNFLFGLIPCLAALTLRRAQVGRMRRGPPRLLPGGQPLLWTLASIAVLLIAVSAVIAWSVGDSALV